MMKIARAVIPFVFAASIASLAPQPLAAQENEWRHGTALIGELKYPKDFERFDYVNPDAPKGGSVRRGVNGTFDTLNVLLPKGDPASGLGLIYDTLMTPSMDEVSAMYGLLADGMRYPDDYSSVTFRMRDSARWHDGKPVTAEDVVWSFNTLVEIHPQYRFYYKHVKSAEVTGDNEVTFTFDQTGNRELPHIVGQLLVLPKHWWEGKNDKGEKRNIKASTIEPPLGSGPYKIKQVTPGRSITYERVDDYWGKDVNVNIGTYNMDELKYEYFRNDVAELEAFKAGDLDWRTENTAKYWANQYEFPAVKEGRVVREELENDDRNSGIMVGFVPNLRKEKFQNPKLREALRYAFNFDSLNKSNFYSQYVQPDSYFFGTLLASEGLPEGKELEILKSLKNPVPEEVFTKEFKNISNANRKDERTNRRMALRLLKEAGYELKGGKAVNVKTGEPLEIELILNGPSLEPVALNYKDMLKRIGIDLKIRTIDSSQFISRFRNRDFDMIYTGWAQSLSPGNEQFEFFGSAAADKASSRNSPGIKNPAIDELIEKVVFAKDRDTLIAATKALDRVLLWNHYIVPGWTIRKTRVARWDKYDHPDPLPEYSIGFPAIWWYDAEKAKGTEK